MNPGLWLAVILGYPECAHCGSQERLQVDHVRPVHAGGPSIPVNLVTLCQTCNMTKSCYWPGHGYAPMPGFDNPDLADAILDAEITWLRDRHGEPEITEHIWRWYGIADALSHHLQ
jgi:hypothetical protein